MSEAGAVTYRRIPFAPARTDCRPLRGRERNAANCGQVLAGGAEGGTEGVEPLRQGRSDRDGGASPLRARSGGGVDTGDERADVVRVVRKEQRAEPGPDGFQPHLRGAGGNAPALIVRQALAFDLLEAGARQLRRCRRADGEIDRKGGHRVRAATECIG